MRAINIKFGNESERVNGDVYTLTALGQQVKAALFDVNGKAGAHAFTCLDQINDLARCAESALENIGIPKKDRAGAVYQATSGDAVPNAYKYSRTATLVNLERRSSGWFLTSIQASTIYKDGGKSAIILTQAQDDIAVSVLRKSYKVKA